MRETSAIEQIFSQQKRAVDLTLFRARQASFIGAGAVKVHFVRFLVAHFVAGMILCARISRANTAKVRFFVRLGHCAMILRFARHFCRLAMRRKIPRNGRR